MNKPLFQEIGKLGLSDKEALIYSTLLDMGGAGFPSKIALKSGIKRSTAYKVLLDMSVKGLVNEIEKKNKRYYQLENPQKLIRYTKDKIRIAKDQAERAEKLLPELEGLFALTQNKPKVTFFEGVEGVLEVYRDHVNVSKKYEMTAFASASFLREFFPPEFFREYINAKLKIGITTRGILPDTERDLTFNDVMYTGVKPPLLPVLRFVPYSVFPFKGEITIYGENKVSIAKLGEKNLIGVIIEDDVIHGMMKMVFELAWKGCEK